jgi:hypothetical protein
MLQVLSPKPHVDAMHGEPVLVANVEHCGDDVQHPILCSCRATHVYVGKNDRVEFTNALASLQPKMCRQTSPFEQVADAPESLAQHDEPPEPEKYADVQRFERMSHVFVEQMLPSLQSLFDAHVHCVSMPVWHDLKPGLNASGKHALRKHVTVLLFTHCDMSSQQPEKRSVGTQSFALHISWLHSVGVDGQPLLATQQLVRSGR